MPSKTADLLMYAVLAALAGIVIWQTHALPNPFGGTIGSGGFPTLMAGLALLLCAIGALRTLRAAAGPRLEFPGAAKGAVTLGAMILLFGLWQAIGHFFLLAFVFLAGLLCFYAADERLSWRLVALNLAGSAVVIGLIKAFFTYVLFVRF